jgi:glycosyltransferase involved in cell wall biosynthesis
VVIPVTVLMAVFNTPVGPLRQAIDSIREQTCRDFEFLIVDDGSTDEHTRHCLEQRSALDTRIRIAWEPHRGLTGALNRGLELARGAWIARQDADDWSEPARLEQQTEWTLRHPEAALLGADAWMHQQDGARLWRTRLPCTHTDILDAFPRRNPFVHGSVLFRADLARAEGGYREVFSCAQDYDLFWRLAERYPAANLSRPLYHYRYAGGAISATRAVEQAASHRAIQELARARQQGRREDAAAALAAARAEMSSGPGLYRALLKQADHRMLAGDYAGAARAYRELARACPGSPLAWAKLARLGVFRAAPFLREACFR